MTRYGIIGMGPVGSAIAAHLASAGQEVLVLCANDAKAEALRRGPIRVRGVLAAEARVHGVFTGLGEFLAANPEVVIIATKSCDSPALVARIGELAPDPRIVFVSCQNGIDVEKPIRERFGPQRTLRMVMNIGCRLDGDNDVDVVFSLGHFLADQETVPTGAAARLARDLSSAGFPVALTRNLEVEVFRKAILNSAMGAIAALTGKTMRGVLEDPGLHEVLKTMVLETIAVAKARGFPIGDDYLAEALAYMARGEDHRPSMAVDAIGGRPTENESHCGAIVEWAKRLGVSVPVNEAICALMRNLEKGRKKK